MNKKVPIMMLSRAQGKSARMVSQAQFEARDHNYTKMIVTAAKSSILSQKGHDVRMTKEQHEILGCVANMLSVLLRGWK
jgi:hypothetical protein